jgi:bifunctional non-homologous end joining protein LigD
MRFCEQHDLEGVIGKRSDSRYTAGPKRSSVWFKVKRVRADDFVVVGLAKGRGSRARLGALELASYEGEVLVPRGRVGSGLDASAIDAFLAHFAPRAAHATPIVVSVEHAGFTPDARLRHPVFRGIRPDVHPSECTAAPKASADIAPTRAAAPQTTANTLTNPDKPFWPDEGITKREVYDYYVGIADVLLPYLHDRPVLMVRYPDGIHGKHFYQWNAPKHLPSYLETRTLRSEDDGHDVTYLRIEDRAALAYVANLGCIPLHILASRFEDPERCDFVTVDFDLGPAPLRDAVTLALELRNLLDQIGLEGFPKTSGQTGLHVLVPVGGIPFAAAKALATLLGRILHQRHPGLSTLERLRSKRTQAVYIDTGQTGRSRAIVAPYSLRAHPGATVSTPLRWDEVGPSLTPARFDLFTVPARVQACEDPMAGLLTARPRLASAMKRLQRLVGA